MMDPSTFELTLEQQFAMRRMEDEISQMSPDQAANLLLEVSKLLMVKDNVIRDLVKKTLI